MFLNNNVLWKFISFAPKFAMHKRKLQVPDGMSFESKRRWLFNGINFKMKKEIEWGT